MVKALLYIFTILGLLISPVHAQAAQEDCAGMSGQMVMAPMAKTMASDSMICCDHGLKDKSAKDTACFNNCIAMCGISVACGTEASDLLPVLAVAQVSFNDAAPAFFTQEPGLVVPPPKSIA